MDSQLSDEEFQRLQTQLLELKTNNYSLEELKRRNQTEIQTLKLRTEELEKQLSRAQTVNKINPLSFARNLANKVDTKFRDKELDQLAIDNENLMRKIESQEQEFKVTNETLKTELRSLIAKNDSLEDQLKTLLGGESHPECDLGVHSDQIAIDSQTNPMSVIPDPQNQLSYAVLAEKEKLELKVNDLQELTENLRKENQLMSTQVEEFQSKCMETDRFQQELMDSNDLIGRQNSLIEEMRAHKLELEHRFKLDSDKLKAEHQTRIEALENKIRSKQEFSQTLETRITELVNKLDELEVVRKENDKLINELESYKEELSFCRTQKEETIERMNSDFDKKFNQLSEKHSIELMAIREECEKYKNRISDLDIETKRLNQQIMDNIEDRKINEKKGFLMVKELKRQLNSERKRAEKLQERLQEFVNESTASITSDIQRKQSLSCNGNDSSSVGSWSFMSAKDNSPNGHNRTSSIHSAGSDGRDSAISPAISPIGNNDNSMVEKNVFILEKENNDLVSRITALQQEKWFIEEKVNQLELNITALNEEVVRKTAIIQYYSMEGRPDRHSSQQSMFHNSDKLTVKRVVDFIKDKGDENMKEINRKVQRMLEETLTKNMHLQENLDSLSQEVVRLKNKNIIQNH